ncbi:MAG TPA: DsbA family protein [Acidimicrobiales bacterium]|nr:DsbA family protein [Acidimicrobiales bacterium]
MTTSFAVTWDYRCPFARNAHEHLVAGLRAGADWEVRFVPFSLDQAHVADGDTAVWDEPDRYPGLLANQVGIVVRDRMPERFLEVHDALFRARHDDARDTRDPQVLADVLAGAGVDPGAVLSEVDDGWPLDEFRKEHEASVDDHRVFGVPTFIAGDSAVFVRVLTRPAGDTSLATSTVDRVLALVTGFADLNEFKHTSIPR